MGKVAVVLKVLPNSVEVNLEELTEEILQAIPEDCQLLKVEAEPIGFGINSLVFTITRDEELGISDVEEKIKSIEGVGDVIVSNITLI
ncbi:MAG: elongation factor 1-beta [Candidatus Nanoarchaeia archaeon]|nr:elongation factor 1-beta [Candidatus Haiyanarchaeum thermophilum]MCW1303446.1 elongation factor 1-beta [Candidatus Haiyanarchaeum thermophilum]MCW1306852.1 elongation factor 1-beta [Candidatus Haiyanarchaeum thermophilum]MCW1308276.1 elongation factor 1-beta [Candidatus Haiyanarchaeum thermophilum]MCW1308626.1 elongation factor 1-beta [Candidatus Haiyanarchaeum thermophilum]